MELKLSVSIGATLQVKNAKGEWDWIKPEVGCEISLANDEVDDTISEQFENMWNNVVGPQFANVVRELISEQTLKVENTCEGMSLDATETTTQDEVDEY